MTEQTNGAAERLGFSRARPTAALRLAEFTARNLTFGTTSGERQFPTQTGLSKLRSYRPKAAIESRRCLARICYERLSAIRPRRGVALGGGAPRRGDELQHPLGHRALR